MSRLRIPPSRLAAPPFTVGMQSAAPAGQAQSQARRGNPLRHLYSTAEWRKLRRQVFKRDGYVCQRSGEICSGSYPAPNSPTANHKVPHRGDLALFWDPENLETVTKAVHDTLIQKEEQGSRHQMGDWS